MSITYTWSNTGGDIPKVSGKVPQGAKVLYLYLEGAPSGFGFALSYINLSHGNASAHIFDAYSDGRVVYPYKGWAMSSPFAGQMLDDGKVWRADAYFTQLAASWRMTITLVIAYEVPAPTPPPPATPDFKLSTFPQSGVLATGGVPINFDLTVAWLAGPSPFTVNLSAVNPPAGIDVKFGTTTVGAFSTLLTGTTITVTALSGTAAGTYWLQIKGRTNEGIERFVTITVVVMPLPIGNFESLSSSGVASGWVFDPSVPNVSSDATVYVSQASGAPLSFSAPTSVYRSDVNTAYNITGNHGFSFAIPSNLLGSSRQVWVYGHGATPAGGGQVQIAGSGKWYCAASAGDIPGTGSCSNRCVKATPNTGPGSCSTDCDCGNASTGLYCYLGPNTCNSTTLVSKTLSGSQSISFNPWTPITGSSSSFSTATNGARNVNVTFGYRFDYSSVPCTLAVNIRLIVDGIEAARDSNIPRGIQTFNKTISLASGNHTLSFEVQSVLVAGYPIPVTFYPGAITAKMVRN